MEHEEIVIKILDQLGWYYDDIARKKHGAFKGWTKGELISLIILYGDGPSISRVFGCGQQAFNRTVKEHLIPIFGPLNGGGESWKNTLLNFIQVRYCRQCKVYKEYDHYHKDRSAAYKINYICKECRVSINKYYYKEVPTTKLSHIASYSKNKDKIRERLLRAKAHLKLATPIWSETDLISKFYSSRPDGFDVDHIVPLRGRQVCGLHVISNLRYLDSSLNRQKSNKFSIS